MLKTHVTIFSSRWLEYISKFLEENWCTSDGESLSNDRSIDNVECFRVIPLVGVNWVIRIRNKVNLSLEDKRVPFQSLYVSLNYF